MYLRLRRGSVLWWRYGSWLGFRSGPECGLRSWPRLGLRDGAYLGLRMRLHWFGDARIERGPYRLIRSP
jgi:hypothetical protein